MAQKLALENAGDEATFTVSGCNKVPTKFGDRYVFLGFDPELGEIETPLIPDKSALKQLERLGLTTDTVIGETLRFSRAPNPSGKPYWNIDVPTGAPAPSKRLASPTQASSSAPASSPAPALNAQQRREAMVSSYLILWETVATNLAATCKAKGIALDASAVQAAAVSIWITWKDRGLQPDLAPAKASAAPAIPSTPAPSGKRLAPPSANEPPDFSNFPPPTDDDLPF